MHDLYYWLALVFVCAMMMSYALIHHWQFRIAQNGPHYPPKKRRRRKGSAEAVRHFLKNGAFDIVSGDKTAPPPLKGPDDEKHDDEEIWRIVK